MDSYGQTKHHQGDYNLFCARLSIHIYVDVCSIVKRWRVRIGIGRGYRPTRWHVLCVSFVTIALLRCCVAVLVIIPSSVTNVNQRLMRNRVASYQNAKTSWRQTHSYRLTTDFCFVACVFPLVFVMCPLHYSSFVPSKASHCQCPVYGASHVRNVYPLVLRIPRRKMRPCHFVLNGTISFKFIFSIPSFFSWFFFLLLLFVWVWFFYWIRILGPFTIHFTYLSFCPLDRSSTRCIHNVTCYPSNGNHSSNKRADCSFYKIFFY